jgi:uncharacterized membrane protein YfcA
VGLLAAGSLPTSLLLHALLINSQFQDSDRFESVLTSSLGVMLIITAMMLIFRDKLRKGAVQDKPRPLMQAIHSQRAGATVAMGLLLGVCVTLSSVGAGAFAAAVLLIIYDRTATARIVGTDIAHAVPLTFLAGMGYFFAGYVDLMLLISLLLGSLPAINLGSRLGSRVPDKLLQRLLTALLLGLGVYYSLA